MKTKPPASADFTDTELAIWNGMAPSLPMHCFDSDRAPLLIAYIRTFALHNDITMALRKYTPAMKRQSRHFDRYIALVGKQERLTYSLVKLVTKLGITQQQRTNADGVSVKIKHHSAGTKPWERLKKVA